ncbi:MAG: aminotransferase class I/II-fold pyridoxal phosphate-dependent enzyme [Gammaproteobacteria bacterium]|nr:MAG: aminotransferase class I/II-fold pyridoxal phosphate-dependent enzyme [Gammaproteobacteria bacterium]
MTKEQEFIVFGAPDIRDEEIPEVVQTLRSGWIGTGPKVSRFEQDFSKYKNVSPGNTLALNSCTSALHLALISAGVKSGDEVITTATTFCATVNAIIHSGATPVLVDIDPETLNIDVNKIETVITKNTKVILPVHLTGLPCDMGAIVEIANKNNLIIIEDCAHAIESEYKGKKIGTIGDYGCFSFYSTKNVVTAEGGMMIAKDKKMINASRKLSLQGMDHDAWNRFGSDGYKHYSIYDAGFKYNMTDISASLGIHQLARVEEMWARRQSICEFYIEALSDLPVILPFVSKSEVKHAHHLFVIQINEQSSKISRDSFIEGMKNAGIGTGVHYKSIASYQFYINKLGLNPIDFPHSIKNGDQTVSLPLSGALTDCQVERIVNSIIHLYSR